MELTQAAAAATMTYAFRAPPSTKRRRSYRPLRREELPRSYGNYKLWRTIANIMEDALERKSIRTDVQQRIWRMMLVMLSQHGAPELWGRPISISRHTKLLQLRLRMSPGEIRTAVRYACELGLLDRLNEPLKHKPGSVENEPAHYIFGVAIRTALQRIYTYIRRRLNSPRYRGVFSISFLQAQTLADQEKDKASLYLGWLIYEKRLHERLRARMDVYRKPRPATGPVRLETIADDRLRGSLTGLLGKMMNRVPMKPEPEPEPVAEPDVAPGTVAVPKPRRLDPREIIPLPEYQRTVPPPPPPPCTHPLMLALKRKWRPW